jgi:hypothetical protein
MKSLLLAAVVGFSVLAGADHRDGDRDHGRNRRGHSVEVDIRLAPGQGLTGPNGPIVVNDRRFPIAVRGQLDLQEIREVTMVSDRSGGATVSCYDVSKGGGPSARLLRCQRIEGLGNNYACVERRDINGCEAQEYRNNRGSTQCQATCEL